MRIRDNWLTTISSVAVLAILGGCSSTPTTPGELERARDVVARVASMPESSTLASAELKAAQDSLLKAEEAARHHASDAEVSHLAYLAEQQASIAEAKLHEAQAANVTKNAEAQRNAAIAEARERDAAAAEQRATKAEASAAEAWRQLEAAKETERGIVLTMGDMLFDTGRAELKPGAQLILDRLASFLRDNPTTRAIIEGHTDNVGSPAMNQQLSETRASAVAAALESRGI